MRLQPAQLEFLLHDLAAKLQHSLTSVEVRRSPFAKVRILKIENRYRYSVQYTVLGVYEAMCVWYCTCRLSQ